MGDRDLSTGVDLAELNEGAIIGGRFEGEDVVIMRHGGRLCALAGKCTHLKAPLADGLLVDGELRCPWHHARFKVETGEAVGAPAFAPLARFEVVETDGLARVVGRLDDAAPSTATRDPGRVVIVGAGAAGHACAEMLVRHGAGAKVTLLSDDRDSPYDRTFCSKQYLAGKAERADTSMSLGRPEGGKATVRHEVSVTRILPDERVVETAEGERIRYDALVLATGSAAAKPEFQGAERDDVHVVRTLADADRLIAAIADAHRAVVVGASFIGLEVAASLIARDLAVTVVAPGEIPLAKMAGPEVGGMIRSLHEEKGVEFRLGREVASWDGSVAVLDDGSRLEGDLLVAGVGAEPRTDLARRAGLTMAADEDGGGVLVDADLRTSQDTIYAVGDIASVPDPRLGHRIRVEHWVVAQRMGQWLARRLLGQVDGAYEHVPFFWSGHYDTSLRYVGHVASPEDRSVDGDVAAKDVEVTFREDGEDRALLTCGRDMAALTRQAAWER